MVLERTLSGVPISSPSPLSPHAASESGYPTNTLSLPDISPSPLSPHPLALTIDTMTSFTLSLPLRSAAKPGKISKM